MNNSLMISGIGQFHTNEADPTKPDKKVTPYLRLGFDAIKAMVNNPQQVDKAQAQWLIPSSLPSRNFKEQEQHGEYWMLWADLDKHPPSLPDLVPIVEAILCGCDFELYNSRSATAENQKARILIFLDKPLTFDEWTLAQEILNDCLEAQTIIPDSANERAAQLCYLSNRGAFYGSESRREGRYFNPLQAWAQGIAAKREKLEAERGSIGHRKTQHNG